MFLMPPICHPINHFLDPPYQWDIHCGHFRNINICQELRICLVKLWQLGRCCNFTILEVKWVFLHWKPFKSSHVWNIDWQIDCNHNKKDHCTLVNVLAHCTFSRFFLLIDSWIVWNRPENEARWHPDCVLSSKLCTFLKTDFLWQTWICRHKGTIKRWIWNCTKQSAG